MHLTNNLQATDELEIQVIGSMVDMPQIIGDLIDVLTPDMFNNAYRRKMYTYICDLFRQGIAVSMSLIMDDLKMKGRVVDFGGEQYIAQLTQTTYSPDIAMGVAARLADKYWLRVLMRQATEVLERCNGYDSKAEVIADEFLSKLLQLSIKSGRDNILTLSEINTRFQAERLLHCQLYAETKSMVTGLRSGLKSLDNITTGFKNGDMIVIGARPSVGKTAIALNIATHNAFVQNKKVLFFSLEMNATRLFERIISSHLDIPAFNTTKTLNQDENYRYAEFLAHLSDYQLYIEDAGSLTIADIRARARRKFRDLKGLDLIIIDYLQFIIPNPNAQNKEQQVSEISRGIKQLARELNVPIIACAQLNRKVADRENPYPKLSDLRDSGAIEQDSDLVLLIHRDDKFKLRASEFHANLTEMTRERLKDEYLEKYHKELNVFDPNFSIDVKAEDMLRLPYDILVAKHRNGATGMAKSIFYRQKTKFIDKYVEYEGEN